MFGRLPNLVESKSASDGIPSVIAIRFFCGTEFKVMQELLRHASLHSTLDIYTQAISPTKHAAQAAALPLVFSSETNVRSRGETLTSGR